MRLEQSFEVPVPVSQAWSVLLDVERVAPCMPGATLTGYDGTAFTGTVKVKLGPVSLAYKGNGRFVERDEPGKRVSFIASGQDSRGAGGAQARVTAVLHETKGGTTTQVKVVADVAIAGRAAQFGRGMIADVSGKLVKQFADCLAQTIASSPAVALAAAPPASVVSAPAPPPAPVVTVPLPEPPAEPAAPEPPAESAVTAPPAETPSAETPSPALDAEPIPVADVAEIPAPEPAPEYHPLALQEPPEPGTYPEPEPIVNARPAPVAPPEPEVQPETAYAYEPPPPPPVAPPPVPQPTTLSRPQVEAEPIDLLAVSGAKGLARRAAPVLIVVAIIVVALIIWLVVR